MDEARIEGNGARCNDFEIECLKVNKVYFSCQLRECIEDQLFDLDYPAGCSRDYKFVRVEYGNASIEPIKHMPLFTEIDEYHARLKGVVAIPIYVVIKRKSDGELLRLPARPIIEGCKQKDNKVRFPIDILVYAPAQYLRQGRFFADAESLAESDDDLARFTGNDNIELTIGFFIIVKVISKVQLKIPSFGFCDIPPECDEVSPISDVFCETFLDEDLTPFPTKFFPPQRNQIGDIEDDRCPDKRKRR